MKRCVAMRLRDVLARLSEFDADSTIYAAGGVVAELDAVAIVALEPDSGGLLPEARELQYFLEVDQAVEALAVWREWRDDAQPTNEEVCEAVLYYARNDAYLPAGSGFAMAAPTRRGPR